MTEELEPRRNDRLEKPKRLRKTRGCESAIIYSLLDWDRYVMFRGDCFVPTWDRTDHLNFACKCGAIAEVMEVRYKQDYPGAGDALIFLLECRDCGATGQRKIYLRYKPGRMAFCQRTITDKNELASYGVANTPVESIPLNEVLAKEYRQRRSVDDNP